MTTTLPVSGPTTDIPVEAIPTTKPRIRVASIDAMRGLTIFVMIVVNNLGGPPIVPQWMRHWKGPGSGLTFVDLVFPAFLFIAGMSIPFALLPRLLKGYWVGTLAHIVTRSLALLMIGVLMANEQPDPARLGWSGHLWEVLMYTAAIAAFFSFGPPWTATVGRAASLRRVGWAVRAVGFACLLWLALAFRGPNDERLLQLSPFFINTKWWGILGHIGWAYLISATLFMVCRMNRQALIACLGLMLALYAADAGGAFEGTWLKKYIAIGGQLGTRPMLMMSGVLLGVMLIGEERVAARVRFTVGFVIACGIGAYLLAWPYGVSKVGATPTWALAGCVATAMLWLGWYLIGDVLRLGAIGKPFIAVGQVPLLAYILGDLCRPIRIVLGIDAWYTGLVHDLTGAVLRAVVVALIVCLIACGIQRAGIRMRL